MVEYLESIGIRQYVMPLIYIAIAVIFYYIFKSIVNLVFKKPEQLAGKMTERQAHRVGTVRAMLLSAAKYVAMLAVFLGTLSNFGIDVSSLLAGLGILTAIIGLAFQDLAKDIIAGFSIITEAQYEVGDLIEVNGFRGRVTSIGLKTTRIKNYTGKELIMSNRNMDKVINYSTYNTLAEVWLNVSYEAKPEDVEKALQKCKAEIESRNYEQIVGEIKIFGPGALNDSSISWKMQVECLPYKHFKPRREIRREALKQLEKAGIEIPYNKVKVVK